MANPKRTSPKLTASTPKAKGDYNWLLIISDMVGKFGLRGTFGIAILYVFLAKGTDKQHQEFIDIFILLKFGKVQQTTLYFLVVLSVIAYIITIRHLRRRIKDRDNRIAELNKEKTALQNKLLK